MRLSYRFLNRERGRNMGVGIKQKNDAVIRLEGMRLLIENMGKVDAERFISLVIREPFDYTEWQKDLFQGMSLDELGDRAMEFYNSQK